MMINFGNVINKGFEIMGKFYVIIGKNFNWDFDVNIFFNCNKISGFLGDQFV